MHFPVHDASTSLPFCRFPENRANAPARAGGHNHNRATGSSSSTTSVVGPGIVGEAVSPELSMVLEKAVVLLNNTEFSALRRILAEYESGELNIDAFAENLIHLISDQEKVKTKVHSMSAINQCFICHFQTSFFTEIREIVRQEDLIRFDRLIFGRGGNAIFDQLLQEHQRPQRAQQHQQHPQKQQQPPQQPQQASQQPPPVANSGPPEYTPRPSQSTCLIR